MASQVGLSTVAMIEVEILHGFTLQEEVTQILVLTLRNLVAVRKARNVAICIPGARIIVCYELVEINFCREEGIRIRRTAFCVGIVTVAFCFNLVIQIDKYLCATKIAVGAIGVEHHNLNGLVVEHADCTKMDKRLQATHTCAANGQYEKLFVHYIR